MDYFAYVKERFSVSELAEKIRDAPNFPTDQVPVHRIQNTQRAECIIMDPMFELQDTRSEPFYYSDDSDWDPPTPPPGLRKDVFGLKKAMMKNRAKQRKRRVKVF